jgi:hydrogenase nickel incorporation protein HypB
LAFNTSQLAVVTKIDIADAVGYDRAAARRAIDQVNPGMIVLELSARTGDGMEAWMTAIVERIRSKAFTPAG